MPATSRGSKPHFLLCIEVSTTARRNDVWASDVSNGRGQGNAPMLSPVSNKTKHRAEGEPV